MTLREREQLEVLGALVRAEVNTRDAYNWVRQASHEDLPRARVHLTECLQAELARLWAYQKVNPEGARYGAH